MTVSSVSFLGRIWLSWVCAFRILFDGRFAARVAELSSGAAPPSEAAPPSGAALPSEAAPAAPRPEPAMNGALQLLALLQREGRFVDFVQQDVAAFPDADIGAAARVVHDGCRRALQAHARVVSVRSEAEGAPLTLDRATPDVKLVGNVTGSAPYRGVLRHRGWRVEQLTLPTLVGVGAQNLELVAPAELELP